MDRKFDLASSATQHVTHHVTKYSKDYEMTNFATGTGMQVQLDSAEKTNTAGFHGESNVFKTENHSGKVTFTLIGGKPQDKIFQAEHNEKADEAGDNFTFYDSANGERINMYGCTFESQSNGQMQNNTKTQQWVWLVADWHRSFDDGSSVTDYV